MHLNPTALQLRGHWLMFEYTGNPHILIPSVSLLYYVMVPSPLSQNRKLIDLNLFSISLKDRGHWSYWFSLLSVGEKKEKYRSPRLGISMGWLSLFFLCDDVRERLLAKFLSASTSTVMFPSGRTLSLRLHTEMALCNLGAKQAGFPVTRSWDTPSPTADRKSSIEQICITENSNRDLGGLPGPSHPHPPPTSLFSKPWFMTL